VQFYYSGASSFNFTNLMNLPFYISRRYLISKKSHNIINFIAIVSVVGVTIGTMALIIVLSVFNGFENLVLGLVNTFNPELKIEVKKGKTFHVNEIEANEIRNLEGVAFLVEVVEESALIRFEEKQHIITLKGVSEDFEKHSNMKDYLLAGQFRLHSDDEMEAVMGAGIAYHLGFYFRDFTPPLSVYLPKRTRRNFTGTFDQSFNNRTIPVSAVFGLQQEFDEKYIIVPIEFTRDLLEYSDEVTSLEIGTVPGTDIQDVQNEVQEILGPEFAVKNQFQQQETLYKILSSEKWITFLILAFILIIATFNVIGSLSMLIIEKKKDIAVLWSLGASQKLVKRIFTFEGMLISVVGGVAGLILGGLLAWLQQQFGIIKLGGGSYIIDAYPVKVEIMDFIQQVWFPKRRYYKFAHKFLHPLYFHNYPFRY